MNPYFNCIEVIGNLGKKPTLSYLNPTTAVTRLNIAVNEKYIDKVTGKENEIIQWFRAVVYGTQAELACEYLNKGDSVFIRGAMRWRTYLLRDERREIWEIHADKLIMLSPRKD
jgi:single-strand DNA-binding protein